MHDEWQRGIAAGIYKPMTKPCIHGHMSVKYVKGSSNCVECSRARSFQRKLNCIKNNRIGTYIGTPCRRGHSGERYVSGNGCVECVRGQAKRQYQAIRSCPERWEDEKARLREMRI